MLKHIFLWLESVANFFINKHFIFRWFIVLFALSLPVIVYFDPRSAKDMGELSLSILVIIVFAGPTYKILPIKITKLLLIYRPEISLVMGFSAMAHGMFYILKNKADMYNFITNNIYLFAGFLAFLIVIPMLITSNKLAMKLLGRFWFKIHKLVYALFVLSMFHGIFISHGNDILYILQFTSMIVLYFGIKYLSDKHKDKIFLKNSHIKKYCDSLN